MPHSSEESHEHMRNSHEHMHNSHEHMSNSHEHMSNSHEHMSGSHEHGDSGEHDGMWAGCSRRFWGDDEHEHAAKKLAMVGLFLAVVIIIVVTVVVVVCCRRRRRMRKMTVHQRLPEEKCLPGEFDPDTHPKAKEVYPVVVIAPAVSQGEKAEEATPTDPRLTLGVWSQPPPY